MNSCNIYEVPRKELKPGLAPVYPAVHLGEFLYRKEPDGISVFYFLGSADLSQIEERYGTDESGVRVPYYENLITKRTSRSLEGLLTKKVLEGHTLIGRAHQIPTSMQRKTTLGTLTYLTGYVTYIQTGIIITDLHKFFTQYTLSQERVKHKRW